MLLEYTITITITITYDAIKHVTTQFQYDKLMLDTQRVARKSVSHLDNNPVIEYNYTSGVVTHLNKYNIDRFLMNSESDTDTYIESVDDVKSQASSTDTQTEINVVIDTPQ